MDDRRDSLVLLGLFGLGAYAIYKLSEWAAKQDQLRRQAIDESRETDVVTIEKIHTEVMVDNRLQYLHVPIDMTGRCINVAMPRQQEVRKKYLVTADRRTFFIPNELSLAVMPFKEGETVEITSIQLPTEDVRWLETIAIHKQGR